MTPPRHSLCKRPQSVIAMGDYIASLPREYGLHAATCWHFHPWRCPIGMASAKNILRHARPAGALALPVLSGVEGSPVEGKQSLFSKVEIASLCPQ